MIKRLPYNWGELQANYSASVIFEVCEVSPDCGFFLDPIGGELKECQCT